MFNKFTRSSSLLVLVLTIWLELSIRRGICDDSQLSSSSYQRIESGNESSSNQHAHHSWNGWEDWIPSSTQPTYDEKHDHNRKQGFVPLSLSEQAKLRYRKTTKTEKKSAGKPNGQTRSSKTVTVTEKTGKKNVHREGEPLTDFQGLREAARSLAASVMNQIVSSWSSFSPSSQKSSFADSTIPRNSRAVYLDNLGQRQDGPNFGKPERDAKRGVIDWLSRLIGVQGKTLGEFLREYQVHVLYDLAFTFFKWIFFLYAGLLIP